MVGLTGMVDTGASDTGTEGAEGGDCVLPLLLPVAFGLGTALNTVYGVGQALDSNRYWSDYYKNTGYKPRYPFRAGQFDWMSDIGHSAYSVAYWYGGQRRYYRRRRRRMTTQFAQASYQEIVDLHTTTDKVSIIGIHTPVTDAPYTFLKGFFDSFQKYHYDGCSLSLVPAARLPADPSQVSYEGGEQPIDPRDLLNPILWHGAHGESLGAVLNQFYSTEPSTTDVIRDFFDSGEINKVSSTQVGNDAIFESLYYRALTDNTWKKAHPQSGFRIKGLHPMVYSLGTDRQYLPNPNGSLVPSVPHRANSPLAPSDSHGLGGLGNSAPIGQNGVNLAVQGSQALQRTLDDGTTVNVNTPIVRDGSFFTERLHGLGWLDTRIRTFPTAGISTEVTGDDLVDRIAMGTHYQQVEDVETINYLPRLFMGVCLLPPAYKANQYYRLVLNHRFSFRKFRGLSMDGGLRGRFDAGNAPSYNNLNTF